MAKVSLKHIIGNKKELHAVINSLISQLKITTWVEDEKGKVLIGEQSKTEDFSFPIMLGNDLIGKVKGEKGGEIIASLLTQMILKEAEKKDLGSEVLNLYQELNVIFNFTEKLTETIDPDTIAQLTLEQAIHSISSHSGVIVLWDEDSRELQIPAMAGEALFDKKNIQENAVLLLKIGLSGQSEIMANVNLLKESKIIDDEVHSLMYAAMKVKQRIMGAIILAGKENDQFSAGHLKLLVTLALQSSGAIESALLYEKNIKVAKEREEAMLKIHEVTKKFVPNEFISMLGKVELTDVRLGDLVEKVVTVLFTDIREFTTLSEKMTPEENFRFVSSFNSQLGPIIRSNNGFINQYLGDSIMAIFPNSPEDALKAAIGMQKAITELNKMRISKGRLPINAGIGMHTGPLIMGITGDEHRLDAATISDTVNTAARIESLTKHFKAPLLLSQETYSIIINKHKYNTRNLGGVRLKGKNKSLNIIECFDGSEAEQFEKKLDSLAHFKEAMFRYNDQQFENAITFFETIIATNPNDHTAKYFLDNAVKYLQNGVPKNWTGSEEMLSK